MEKISIIIPVYNAEKTIRRCLESILISKYKQYEIILIDDGSTDNSAAIISEYANRNNQIKVITQANSGPSEARNRGLDLAEGEIIAFVDSDDFVRSDYLEQLAKSFDEKDADVVFFEYYRVMEDGTELLTYKLPEMESDYYINLIHLSEKDMFGYTWIKAFRKKMLRNICFDTDINLFEDEIFTCRLLENCVNIYYLKEAIYFYVCVEESLMQKTHQEYCQFCNRVYHAWENLLRNMSNTNRYLYLQSKANHIATACKYYGLERKVSHLVFYHEMSSSDFIKNTTLYDPFIVAVKERKWCRVFFMHWKYNIKVTVAKCIVRKAE